MVVQHMQDTAVEHMAVDLRAMGWCHKRGWQQRERHAELEDPVVELDTQQRERQAELVQLDRGGHMDPSAGVGKACNCCPKA